MWRLWSSAAYASWDGSSFGACASVLPVSVARIRNVACGAVPSLVSGVILQMYVLSVMQ